MGGAEEDRNLGMERRIPRRDFISGAATGLVGMAISPSFARPSADSSGVGPAADVTSGDPNYPPSLTGLRGQYPGSFETAHRARDGGYGVDVGLNLDTGEEYDLVVVGGGISGLAAAYFYQRDFGENAKILILDNHDDFG